MIQTGISTASFFDTLMLEDAPALFHKWGVRFAEYYLNSSFEKRKEVEDYLEKNDYENYGIGIHGLKSTSATIGALNLSAHAAALERAAKSGDYEFVKNKHDEAMVEYDRILKKIQQTVTSTPSSDDKVKGSDGVMEFAPKGE